MGIHKRILFHATNEREKKAIEHYFPGSEVIIADNLPNPNQPKFISCEKKEGSLKSIFVSRIVSIKNLLFLLGALQNITAAIELTVIGPIEDENYWADREDKE